MTVYTLRLMNNTVSMHGNKTMKAVCVEPALSYPKFKMI